MAPSEQMELCVGDKIEHPEFGQGTVENGWGNHIDVAFPTHGTIRIEDSEGFSIFPVAKGHWTLLNPSITAPIVREIEAELERQLALWAETKPKSIAAIEKASCDERFDLLSDAFLEQEKITALKHWLKNDVQISPMPDDEQLQAIGSIFGKHQVIARAGSGKTSTLVTRVLLLLRQCKVPAGSILVLAFNRKAATDIKRRLLEHLHPDAERHIKSRLQKAHDGKSPLKIETEAVDSLARQLNVALPHVVTFHALAHALVQPEQSPLYDNENEGVMELSRRVQSLINRACEHPAERERYLRLTFLHNRTDWDKLLRSGVLLGRQDGMRFRRSLPNESLKGHPVKSHGEKRIANFLFEHDVGYRYEAGRSWDERVYRPDFTIYTDKNAGVVIEYFGMAGDADYDQASADKREYWCAQPNWTLLEYYPSDIKSEDRFEEILADDLRAAGVQLRKLSEEEVWARIEERALTRLATALAGFIGRCRKTGLNPDAIKRHIQSHQALTPAEELFLEIAPRMYERYLRELAASGDDDFDGLLSKAVERVRNGETVFNRQGERGDLSRLDFLCIDEFQDFSELFHQLVIAIDGQCSDLNLFCVGDDWQAINGFAGSDLRYFHGFRDHFPDAKQLHIRSNYRSTVSVVETGNRLMKGLGEQAMASTRKPGGVFTVFVEDFQPTPGEAERFPGDDLTPMLIRIASKITAQGKTLSLLTRRRTGFAWRINGPTHTRQTSNKIDSLVTAIRDQLPNKDRKRVKTSSVHSMKGLEDDVVVIVDGVEKSFPLIHQDWIFGRVFGDSMDGQINEERRLFYVALTRAREQVFIVSERQQISPFLADISERYCRNIDWKNFPPPTYDADAVLVVVSSPDGQSAPTYAIRELLKQEGFLWNKSGSRSWTKFFSSDNFHLKRLKESTWSSASSGVEVAICDEAGRVQSRYVVNNGEWELVP